MPQRDDKRLQRRLKREIKKAGNKRRRQALKDALRKDPAEAAHAEESFGRYSSESLNGADNDSTRRHHDQQTD